MIGFLGSLGSCLVRSRNCKVHCSPYTLLLRRNLLPGLGFCRGIASGIWLEKEVCLGLQFCSLGVMDYFSVLSIGEPRDVLKRAGFYDLFHRGFAFSTNNPVDLRGASITSGTLVGWYPPTTDVYCYVWQSLQSATLVVFGRRQCDADKVGVVNVDDVLEFSVIQFHVNYVNLIHSVFDVAAIYSKPVGIKSKEKLNPFLPEGLTSKIFLNAKWDTKVKPTTTTATHKN